MQYRILFANESGTGLSHMISLRDIHQKLGAILGPENIVAQFVLKLPGEAHRAGLPPELVVSAPRLALPPREKPKAQVQRTFGDMVMDRMFESKETAATWLGNWDKLLRAFDPHLVVVDYCPVGQMVAYGRWPVFGFGYGYTLPPANTPGFPAVKGGKIDNLRREAEQCERLNRVLSAITGRTLSKLPDICALDGHVSATVPPFDPYLAHRIDEDYAGIPLQGGAPWPGPSKNRGLAYFHDFSQRHAPLLDGLARVGFPVDAYMGPPTDELLATYATTGLNLSPKPFLLRDAMPGRSVAIHMGGVGFALAALFAGVPQVMLHSHDENQHVASVIQSQGAGIAFPYRSLTEKIIIQRVNEAAQDTKMQRAAFDMGRKLAPYRGADPIGRSVEIICKMLGITPPAKP